MASIKDSEFPYDEKTQIQIKDFFNHVAKKKEKKKDTLTYKRNPETSNLEVYDKKTGDLVSSIPLYYYRQITKEEIEKMETERTEAIIVLEEQIDIQKALLRKAYDDFNVKNKQSIYSIFHSSFLFETDCCNNMDYNINVFCPKLERMERCKEVTKMKVSNIAYMLRNEVDDLDKNKQSAYIIHNYRGTDPLTQVNKIDQNIIDIYLKNEQTTSDLSDIILTHY
jgi:dephospho-CoA kinase